MSSLSELLLAHGRRDALVADVTARIESHVAKLSGLRGLSLRTGLSALKAARHDALPAAVARVLPDLVAALEPLYADARAAGTDFRTFLQKHAGEASAALMGVIDARAARTGHTALKTVYHRLRGSIEKELHSALPLIARSLSRATHQDA